MGYRDYSIAKGHIVDVLGHGDFTTITAAVAAASAGQTVWICPGTYTENFILPPGVNLDSFFASQFNANQVTIVGKMTMSGTGNSTVSNVSFKTNGDYCISVSGANATTLDIWDCDITAQDHTAIEFSSSNASSRITMDSSTTHINNVGITLFDHTSAGTLTISYSRFENAGLSSTASNTSVASTNMQYCLISFPLTTSGTGAMQLLDCEFSPANTNQTCVTTAGTGSASFHDTRFLSGTQSAIVIGVGTTVGILDCAVSSSNTDAILNSGTLNYGEITFFGSSRAITGGVQNLFTTKPFSTAGTSVTAQRGTAGFDSTQFTVTDGFVQSIGGPGSYISLTPFIVGTDGFSGFATIAAGITAAVGAGATTSTPMNVYIKPKADGTAYSENLTLQPGVNLVGFDQTVTISGKMTFTQAGTVNIQGLKLQTNSDFLLAVTGVDNSIVNLDDCFLNCTNNTGISFTTTGASSQINLKGCKGDLGTTGIAIFAHSASGNLFFTSCDFTNTGASSTANTASAGSIGFRRTAFENPLTTSGTVVCTSIFSQWDSQATNSTSLTLGSASSQVFHYTNLTSGTASALSISSSAVFTHLTAGSSNVNAITGAGAIQYAFIAFTSSSGVNIVTTTPLATLI